MTEAIKLTCSLPMLGLCDAVLHDESAKVLRAFGEKRELARLRRVPHLGVAAFTVTGINHSRLEYALLQCSIISIVAKQFKGDSIVALSNKVRIPDQTGLVSSGEELLKSWALLGSIGHLQNTYAEERAYLFAARQSSKVAKWLRDSSNDPRVRAWIKGAISDGRDEQLHYAFCYRRISYLPRHDRNKSLSSRLLSALLLPLEGIFPDDPSARFKLARLRYVFKAIRLLSMLAIDSYYSAQPIRFQITQSVLGLPELLVSLSSDESHLDELLTQTAGWLADALYLAPEVVSLRRPYEVRASDLILRRATSTGSASQSLRKQFQRSLRNGSVQVGKGNFQHLLRLTFRSGLQRRLLPLDKISATEVLQREISPAGACLVGVDFNPFSDVAHLDLLVQRDSPTISRWQLLERLVSWIVRAVEVQALNEVRRLLPGAVRANREAAEPVRDRFLRRLLKQHGSLWPQIFLVAMRQLLPDGWSLDIEREGLMSRNETTILSRNRYSFGITFDPVSAYYAEQIGGNPNGLSADALRELEAMQDVVGASDAEIALVCVGTIRVKDHLGRQKDEIDGLALLLEGGQLSVVFVEAKNGGTAHQRERAAFDQLEETRRWIRRTNGFSCRRERILGRGALMTVKPLRPSPNPPE